jgi:hypothetical protein
MSGQHFLVVQPFDPDNDDDQFDIEHPDCPVQTYLAPDYPVEEYACDVQMELDNAGIREWFIHADDPEQASPNQERVTTGRHEIEYWTVRHPGGPWGSDEWSAGLGLVGS